MIDLIFNNMTFHYKYSDAVFSNLNFHVTSEMGTIFALMGISGSGKTTLLKLLTGLEVPRGGSIIINPDEILISYLSQEPVLFEHLSPMENAEYFKNLSWYCEQFDKEIFIKLCEILEMNHILENKKYVQDLSGGERQRLCLLRNLSIRPNLLLLDEPLCGLDVYLKQEFLQTLRFLTSDLNICVIYTTHYPEESILIADEILFLIKEKNLPVSKIEKKNLLQFKNCPVSLDAARIFNYPQNNVIKCIKQNSTDLKIIPDDDEIESSETKDLVYLVLTPGSIVMCDRNGIKFRKVCSNPLFTQVELVDYKYKFILVDCSELGIPNTGDIDLIGKALLYDSDKSFISSCNLNHFDGGEKCIKVEII